jgi:hypothetical protein
MMMAVLAGWTAQQFQAGTIETGGNTNALEAAGVSYPNPLGIFPRDGWFSSLLAGLFLLGLAVGVLVVASVFVRRRGASSELRKQVAWLGYVGLLVAIPSRRLSPTEFSRTATSTPHSASCSGHSYFSPPRSASLSPASWRC